MIGYPVVKKCLTVGIILLFVGIAVAPSINQSIVKASTDDDLVEVTTQACGILGYGNTTVKLTREQYQNLEQYLVEFRARLNQTTTREEAVPIFKEAVVELNKYGLLPRGMSVQKAEKLVTGEYLNKKTITAIQKLTKNKMLTNGTNALCLMVGRAHFSLFTMMHLITLPYALLCVAIFGILFSIASNFALWIAILLMIPEAILLGIGFISPFSIIFAGAFNNGNLSTFGLFGTQIYNESIRGALFGFIGLKLWVGVKDMSDEFFLLGFSLATTNYVP
jgi:hypothetical protein